MKTTLLFLCFLFVNIQSALGADWPTLMGNLQRTGLVENISVGDISKLQLNWKMDLHTEVSASPVVAENYLLIAAENGNLYALDRKTRKLLWIYRTQGGIASTPLVDNGSVYFLSRDGYFYAITLIDAQLRWRFKTGGEPRFSAIGAYQLPVSEGAIPDAWDFYLSSPVVYSGKIIFGSSDQHIYSLDAKTGALVWAFKGDDLFHAAPSLSKDKIFIGSMGTRLYALSAETGERLWDFQGGAERRYSVMLGYVAAATLDNEKIYLGGRDAQFRAFNQSNGKLVWQVDLQGSWVIATAALDEKNLYVATSDTGLVLALDKTNGKEKFRFTTGFWTYASPLIVDKFIFAANMRGEIYGFDKKTGKQLWRYQTPESIEDALDIIHDETGKIINNKVFAPGRQLHAGMEHVKRLGAFIASPVWVDDQLIAVTANGQLLIFKIPGQ